MAEENKKEVRVNVRMPQYLKDKIVKESKDLGINQSEFIRHLIVSYFAKKEK